MTIRKKAYMLKSCFENNYFKDYFLFYMKDTLEYSQLEI